LTNEQHVGVLAITHYNRLLEVLHPISCTSWPRDASSSPGGADLAIVSEIEGYVAFVGDDEEPPAGGALADLFG
jgi:hypothetical protein